MNQITVAFPGLWDGEFTLNKVLFEFTMFGREFSIRWYAVLIVVGMILAGLYGAWRSKQEGIKLDDLLDMALFAIVFGIIGARLYYVLMTLGNGEYKSFYDVIAIWNGGLAIYGGIIAGALTIVVICRIKKITQITITALLECSFFKNKFRLIKHTITQASHIGVPGKISEVFFESENIA